MLKTYCNFGNSWLSGVLLAKYSGKQRVKLAHNTWLVYDKFLKTVSVVYHYTAIVVYYENGDIELCHNYFKTVTTKARMNQFSPFQVYQSNFSWYVVHNDKISSFDCRSILFKSEGE